ncbi:helix-turn-helix domain-containing protein [Brachybacterium sp. NBEC-018]|uniref:helix-turn-helix domain-containing protein n=1 Tax=Brachybacterium sp. NBEC-018 TaxID=2996004 RepID=UPI0021754EFE|nr:helix-turn-helix domain-containing protein [Brachybacterium sp. NBEC-018]UVY83837.1 helix-turn-helix domain-containing protein [Brachybacterium sp. NBEC-018]
MTTTLAPPDTGLYTPQQVARIFQVDTKTLANWRYLGRGPEYVKDGGIVRYPREALQAYLAQRTVHTNA